MLISVIIPTYNEQKIIEECLSSLKEQNTKDFEIIVVDDGSLDKTLKVLQNLQLSIFNLQILKQKHQGPAMARNLGAKHAKGKILVFVDSDMTFDSKFLRDLIKPILENKTKGTFSKDEYVSNWNNIWAKCWNINENLPGKRRLPFKYPDHQKVFRAILKSEFERAGGFSRGGYTDDYTLSVKLGYEAIVAPGAIFYHKNPESLGEIYSQAKWIAKREYKIGLFGDLVALVRSSLPVSLLIGIYKSIKFNNFQFTIFKIIYDFGVFIGILEMIFTGKTAK